MHKSFLYLLLALISLSVSANQGYLGVSVKSDDINSQKGLRIVNIYDDGAAWVAGLHENDLITHFNGKAINSSADLSRMIALYQWGDIVSLTYIRDHFSQHADIVLGYDVLTKTYEILKSEQISGEVFWYFKDNTTIIMKDGSAVSVTKKFEHGDKETFELTDIENYNELPQRFRDLEDKLDVIERTIQKQMDLGSNADEITFVKENIREAKSNSAAIEKLEISEFNVFPNPSNGQFEVKLATEETGLLTWDIYDVRGSSIASGQYGDFDGNFSKQFNLSSKFTGTYLLYIRVGDHRISKQLIVK